MNLPSILARSRIGPVAGALDRGSFLRQIASIKPDGWSALKHAHRRSFARHRQVASTYRRSMHQSSVCKAVTLPDLPYAKNALEPTMCEETLDIHQYVERAVGLAHALKALA